MATKKERGALAPEELVAGERAVVELEAVLAGVDEGARTPRQEQVSAVREVLSRQGSLLGQLGSIRAGVVDHCRREYALAPSSSSGGAGYDEGRWCDCADLSAHDQVERTRYLAAQRGYDWSAAV